MKYYIYIIKFNEDESYFYIGSTNNYSSRKSHHKKNVTNKVGRLYWSFLYHYIRKHGGWSNFTMEIIDEGEVNTKKDIKVIEQRFIEERNPILNSISAST
jgi:predicted GIY-YIG superfamily endonuclease